MRRTRTAPERTGRTPSLASKKRRRQQIVRRSRNGVAGARSDWCCLGSVKPLGDRMSRPTRRDLTARAAIHCHCREAYRIMQFERLMVGRTR